MSGSAVSSPPLAESPEGYSLTRVGELVGLHRNEVATVFHEHDVPVRYTRPNGFLVAHADYLAIRPVLLRLARNKDRRYRKLAGA